MVARRGIYTYFVDLALLQAKVFSLLIIRFVGDIDVPTQWLPQRTACLTTRQACLITRPSCLDTKLSLEQTQNPEFHEVEQ